MIMTPQNLGQLLRRIRQEKGLTQLALGASIGLTSAGMSKLEAGARETTSRILFAWVAACDYVVELRPRHQERGMVLDLSELTAADRALVAEFADGVTKLDELQKELWRAQMVVLRRVSPSDRQELVKSGPG